MTRILAVLVAILCLGGVANAERLRFEGHMIEGGLVLGRTEPDARVSLDGRDVRVGADGLFVIGFHREEPEPIPLTVSFADGSVETRELTVERRDYDIQRIDGLPEKMVTPPEAVYERIKRDAAQVRAARDRDTPEPFFLAGWIWPTEGVISGVYGSQRILNGTPKQPHYGIDIAAPEGTPVKAPSDGIVSMVAGDMYYTGGTVLIDHGFGLSSAFLHMKEISVAEDQRVAKGEVIGTVGSTGRSTGPHLDWRINWFDKRLDASLLAPPMPTN